MSKNQKIMVRTCDKNNFRIQEDGHEFEQIR